MPLLERYGTGSFQRFADHHGLVLVDIRRCVVECGAEKGDSQRLANVKKGIDRKITITFFVLIVFIIECKDMQ